MVARPKAPSPAGDYGGRLVVDIPGAPVGTTLTVREPHGARSLVPLIPAVAS